MTNLKHIEINIWKACNNKCKFCMSSKPENWDIKFVELWILKFKIKDYYERWYRSIWFLGWDISIHPKIKEIISHCKEIWFININIISNAMKFDNKKFCDEIISSWVTRVNISIHSHDELIEDNLTQVKWWLNRKLKAIDNLNLLIKNKILRDALSINIVLNKLNLPSILETILYFYKVKNINDIRINFIWLEHWVKDNWSDLTISYEEFLPYLKKIIFVSIKYNIRITFDTVPACILYKIDTKNYKSIIKKFLWEDYDHITEIEHINAWDVFDWKKRKKDELKHQSKDCEKCIYFNSCQWVRKEYVNIYGFKEFLPITK